MSPDLQKNYSLLLMLLILIALALVKIDHLDLVFFTYALSKATTLIV